MVDVFISYSRRDQPFVARIAHALEAEGYDVWWDAELPPHQSYGDVITTKIAQAKAAVVVWSADAVQSEWVRAEADMARNQKKLIQTAIDTVMPPLPFNQIQFAEIGDWQGESDHPGWRKVRLSLADLCGRDAPAAARPAYPIPDRAPLPLPPQSEPSVSAPQAASRAPLFAGTAIAVVAIVGAALFVFSQRDVQSSPPSAAATPAGSADGGDEVAKGAAADASQFNLLATVSDPDGYTNVRDAPVISGNIIARVQEGEAFSTYRQSGDWWQVRLADGTIGYLAHSRVRLSGEHEAADEPAGDASPEPPDYDPGDMTFPDSSTRLIERSELTQLGPSTLRVARNEIYARKGRRFNDPWLRDYFSNFSWYRPRYDEVPLNPIEQRNIALIQQVEARYQ